MFPNKRPAFYGKGIKRPGEMNKLESSYNDHLKTRLLVGEISWYAYEPVKLRLADKTFYTPDFMVMLPDGTLEFHETKGWMLSSANVKIKVAAELFPIRFILVKKDKGAWVLSPYE